MGLFDEVLGSLSNLNRENLRKGKFSPSGGGVDPRPIDDSVLSKIPSFKPNQGFVADPVPARQA